VFGVTALSYPLRIRVVQPFNLKPCQFGFDPIRERQVGDRGTAINRHQIGGQAGYGFGILGHAPSIPCGAATTERKPTPPGEQQKAKPSARSSVA
jgi:hypothetical protein